jgi:hypothetical protein
LFLGDAAAIILHLEEQSRAFFRQTHIDPGRIGVPNDIGQRFLENAKKSRVEILIPNGLWNGGFDAAPDARLFFELIGLPLQGCYQSGGIQDSGRSSVAIRRTV